MIGFAAAIAALGLAMNSPAVIIGAMVIAPLMSAIFGISLGVVMALGTRPNPLVFTDAPGLEQDDIHACAPKVQRSRQAGIAAADDNHLCVRGELFTHKYLLDYRYYEIVML